MKHSIESVEFQREEIKPHPDRVLVDLLLFLNVQCKLNLDYIFDLKITVMSEQSKNYTTIQCFAKKP